MVEDFKKFLHIILRPIIAFALRHGLSIQDFIEVSKSVYIEKATSEIILKGEKVSSSRISAMTGIRRPEIRRLSKEQVHTSSESLISRVIAQWEQDPMFTTKAKKPRILSFGKDGSDFNSLVFAVSTDMHPATLLFELERLDLVERTPRGLALKERKHLMTEDVNTGFALLSEDIDQLTRSIEENLLQKPEVKNLHGKTIYDNIYHEDLEEIKRWLLKEGGIFHNKIRNYLAQFDKDINIQEEKTPGATVSVCTFSNTKGVSS